MSSPHRLSFLCWDCTPCCRLLILDPEVGEHDTTCRDQAPLSAGCFLHHEDENTDSVFSKRERMNIPSSIDTVLDKFDDSLQVFIGHINFEV